MQGNTDAFAVVRVPTPERIRALTRHRGAVLKERQRCILRGHGLMLAQGIVFFGECGRALRNAAAPT